MSAIRRISLVIVLLGLPITAHAVSNVYELKVDGLACPFCAYGIEKKLSRLEGVAEVEVDLKEGRVVVTMTEGKTLSEAHARKAVTEAGFTLKAFSQVPGGKR